MHEEASSAVCATPSTIEGYSCQQAPHPSFIIHWSMPSPNVVNFAVEAPDVEGWIGVGFPEVPGHMAGALAIQGSATKGTRVTKIDVQWAHGRFKGSFKDAEIPGMDADSVRFTQKPGQHQLLEFTRTAADGFDPSAPIDLIGAYHTKSDDWNRYHNGRFGFQVDLLSQEAPLPFKSMEEVIHDHANHDHP